MKTLWTPWRMAHILGEGPVLSGCLFEPPGESTQDKPALLLFRDEMTVVLLNRFPYANGHLLVAPRRHVADLTGLNSQEALSLMLMLAHCETILRQHLKPHGFNIGLNLGKTAGAGIVGHLHFHVVPRWEDDHNFITVCADIRTIPQHIEHTFDLLSPGFLQLFNQTNP